MPLKVPLLPLLPSVCNSGWGAGMGVAERCKPVNEEGGKASFGQVAGRTICRLIPFEIFSFFGTPCRGWHDKIPKTFVVKAR
ncbi:hypothetical protein FF011L_38550 [Roseimaritima multifibrata]|uniref:Uncharacterized protein n=1 Tax=Roseimaritima multifibrata TaxID=1930274 RepID=A0A517MJJ9_9BACT|nr:hypothetical protein FF011L_38550 [Roseimaritima multifibrata]